jgi:hypothetical protein
LFAILAARQFPLELLWKSLDAKKSHMYHHFCHAAMLKDTLLPNFNTDTFIWRVSMLQITAT